MKIRQSLTAVSIVFGLAFPGTAYAHGSGKKHVESESNEPVEKEQTAWGIADDAANAVRTVNVAMLDKMRFEPASVKVKEGETIRFVIANNGQIMHEFVLGTQKALDKHAAMMVKFPKMEHEEPYMAHVAPGNTGEIVWKFNRGGDFKFACLIPGHYQAGMIGALNVNTIPNSHGHAEKKPHDHSKKTMKHAHEKKKKHAH